MTIENQENRSTISEATAANSAREITESESWIGRTIAGHYLISKVLGSGGMSVVYQANHTLLNETRAIKILNARQAGKNAAFDRFCREAKAAGGLRHEGIAAVKDYGITEDGHPYIVMDHIQGTPLSDLLDLEGPMSPVRTSEIASQIARGMAHAHKAGIVHRDLKPSNIIVRQMDGADQITIIDFGIAKSFDAESVELTQTGEIYGTPLYMSPEHGHGSPLDGRADVYSLGCLIYELVSGEPPFSGEHALEILMKHAHQMPPQLNAGQLNSVVQRALEKEPIRRYQSMDELDVDLRRVIEGRNPASSTNVVSIQTRRMLAWSIDSFVLFLLGTFIGLIAAAAGLIDREMLEASPWAIVFAALFNGTFCAFDNLMPGCSLIALLSPYQLPSIILLPIVNWLYHAFMESARWKGTLGKVVVGLAVTDKNGQRINFKMASQRHLCRFFTGWMTLSIGVGLALMLHLTAWLEEGPAYLGTALLILLLVQSVIIFATSKGTRLLHDRLSSSLVENRARASTGAKLKLNRSTEIQN